MKHDYFKYYKSKLLMLLIIYTTTIFLWMKSHWEIAASVTTVLGGLFLIIDKYLWKYKPFKWLFYIDDFSGRYEGVLKYQYRDKDGNLQTGELPHVKLINQNGGRITISSFTIKSDGTKSSLSVNKGLHVEKTEDEQLYRLIYSYLNDGSKEQGFAPHYGTEVIKFIKKGKDKILSGGYYTEREPYQTKGEFAELIWVSNDLSHEF